MMAKAPSKWELRRLLEHCQNGPKAEIDGEWLPARTLGFYSIGNRLRCAWLVFSGKADVLVWPEAQEAIDEE